MDRVIIIANIISGIGTLGMLISTFLKNKDSMLKLSNHSIILINSNM